VLTDSAVKRIDDEGVVVSGRPVAARNVFWAAGVMASPAAQWLKAEADQAGRVKVVVDLSVPGLPDVFAIGDTALSNGWNGKPVPGLAPAAKQQGRYVASIIKARIGGRPPPAPFRYRHSGSLATIGRKRRSPISVGCGSPVLSLGGSGASSTSCSCQGCAIEW
jgi:NADH dehydrogenase FAD-containing subunit